jgi:drug/metabolite transporter (DMT)-like permease
MEMKAIALLLLYIFLLIHDNNVYAFSSTVLKPSDPLTTSSLHMSDTTDTTTRTVEKLTASSTFPSETSVFLPPLQVPVIGALTTTKSGPINPQSDYQKGLLTIGFITLLFASNSPVLHAAFSSSDIQAPPVLLLNAAVSAVALVGLLLGGDSLEAKTLQPVTFQATSESEVDALTLQGGFELGLWKFLGTTANLYGLTLTTAGHGALLIQLTTLIVPLVQGIQGVPIPKRIQASVILALAGVVCFTQDLTGTPSAEGDALCVVAAIFYATYDLRLFVWGKRLPAKRLITTKICTQALLSVSLLLAVSGAEMMEYITSADSTTWSSILPVVLWSGVAVNAVAPFLQVGGQQIVGPTRCQTIYASQPLWAAILSYLFLGETIGTEGLVGGTVFLVALFMAATAEPPDADCGEINCEV